MKIEICLTGFSHDSITWPQCKISIDGQVYIDQSITNKQTITFDVDLIEGTHNIAILQYGKMFGENRVWHTRMVNGQTIGDRYLVINDIKFDDVSVKKIWNNGQITNHFNEKQLADFAQHSVEVPHVEHVPFGYNDIRISYNGGYELNFDTPVYDWIILMQSPLMKIEGKMKESSLTSVVTWRLDYSQGNALAALYNECMDLLKEVK